MDFALREIILLSNLENNNKIRKSFFLSMIWFISYNKLFLYDYKDSYALYKALLGEWSITKILQILLRYSPIIFFISNNHFGHYANS